MSTALVLPFPAIRRRSFIRRHAELMAGMSPAGAERHLRNQLRIQAETLARKGVASAVIQRERDALERAIRSEFWNYVPVRGDLG